MTLKPFKSHFDEVEKALDCLHLDLVGPISPPSVSGYRYFPTVMDQYTSFKLVKFLRQKSDTFHKFIAIKNLVETTQDRKIKKIISDKGGEFANSEFQKLANESGFFHVTSPPYTPQLNGFAEWANRTIMEKERCLLLGANLPNQYWAKAVSHATLLTNLIPTPSRNNLLPFHLWTGSALKIKRIQTFGCKVVFAIPWNKRPWKLAPTGDTGISLGLDYESPAYRVLNVPKPKTDELFFSDERYYPDNEEEYYYCQEHPEIFENPTEEIGCPTDNSASAESSSNGGDESTLIQPERRIIVIGP
ncbi:hypothetical protein O181_022592 [Austropuccinia psidii MF-1]|uniref:Integrase catalytic domain-containing protein n=1 Tax=Austropuccinia psidii MF-1 TaxID=1389203 RepID=A0A9Q3GX97_9BASI|nr:hypothetical protein [Austropuccinia psidii MF-1]